MASKILLGAYFKADLIHPLDYCLRAASVEIEPIPKESEEYKLLKSYVTGTITERQPKKF